MGLKSLHPVAVYVKKAAQFEQKMAELEEFLTRADIKKYMQNGNFDIHAFRRLFAQFGDGPIKVKGFVLDVQVGANLMDENLYKMVSLSTLQMMMTEVKADYDAEFSKKYGKSDMLSVPPEEGTKYACADADITRQVGRVQKGFFVRPENKRLANYLIKFSMPTLTTFSFITPRIEFVSA